MERKFSELKVPELNSLARERGLKRYSKLRKAELTALPSQRVLVPQQLAPDLRNQLDLHHLHLPCHLQLPNQISY